MRVFFNFYTKYKQHFVYNCNFLKYLNFIEIYRDYRNAENFTSAFVATRLSINKNFKLAADFEKRVLLNFNTFSFLCGFEMSAANAAINNSLPAK
jgi:hypothetical protein